MEMRFEIIGAQHDDHPIERPMRLQQDRKDIPSAAYGTLGFIVHRSPPIQSLLDDAVFFRSEDLLHDPRPTRGKVEPRTVDRIVPPSIRITEAENGLHEHVELR